MNKPTIYDSHMHVLNRDTTRLDVLFKKLKLPGSSLMGLAMLGSDMQPAVKWIERLIKIYKKIPYFDVDKVLDMFQLDPDSYARVMMQDMDSAGIDVGFLLMIPQDNDYQQEMSWKAHLEVKKTMGDRCRLFYGWPIDRTETNEKDCLRVRSASGIKCYPSIHKADKKSIENMFEVAKHYKIPIIIHTGPGGIGKYKKQNDPDFWAPWIFKYPSVNVCFAHAVGNSKNRKKAVDFIQVNEMENVFVGCAFNDSAITHPDRYFRGLIDLDSQIPGHVIGGLSDYPLGSTSAKMKTWHQIFKKYLGSYLYNEIFSENVERLMGK